MQFSSPFHCHLVSHIHSKWWENISEAYLSLIMSTLLQSSFFPFPFLSPSISICIFYFVDDLFQRHRFFIVWFRSLSQSIKLTAGYSPSLCQLEKNDNAKRKCRNEREGSRENKKQAYHTKWMKNPFPFLIVSTVLPFEIASFTKHDYMRTMCAVHTECELCVFQFFFPHSHPSLSLSLTFFRALCSVNSFSRLPERLLKERNVADEWFSM